MKTKKIILLFLSALSTFSISVLASNGRVGTLPGSAGVTPMGAATYTIPVWVSPGTNGMQPNLSLVYNSMGGRGMMGLGWSVSGLSAITRGGKDWMHNPNDISTIDMSVNDRYLLDGNLMIVTNGGNYQSTGTQYHTELDDFSKIEAFGKLSQTSSTPPVYAHCPEYFKVYSKSGNILEYGKNYDSRVLLSGTGLAIKWQLNKITDANGNSMTYEYENNHDGFIKKINYTENSIAGIPSYASVEFIYNDNASYSNVGYIGGHEIQQKRQLNQIQVAYNNTVLYTYNLLYGGLFNDHLLEIKYMNFATGESLNSTKVDWGAATSQLTVQNSNTAPAYTDDYFWCSGDFNGDGISDLVSIKALPDYNLYEPFYLHIFNRLGQHSVVCTSQTEHDNLEPKNMQAADINGDGIDELVILFNQTPNRYLCAYTYSQGAFVKIAEKIISTSDFYALKTGDFNGDGRSDAFILNCNHGSAAGSINSYVLDYDASGSTWTQIGDGHILDLVPDDLLAVDINGNGKTEILAVKDFNCEIYELSGNSLNIIYDSGFPTKWHAVYTGDFNGDGKTDLLTWDQTSHLLKIRFATGDGFTSPFVTGLPYSTNNPQDDPADNNFLIADFNGDGKSDVAHLINGTSNRYLNLYFSRGQSNSLFYLEQNILNNPNYNIGVGELNMAIADFNGDGRSDFFKVGAVPTGSPFPYSFHEAEFVLSFHANEKSNLVSAITNGYGVASHFSYEPLTELALNPATGYLKQDNAQFPVMDYSGPLHVVNKTYDEDVNNNILGETMYTYTGAKIHRQGKGFICFASAGAENVATKIASYTNYYYHPTHYYPLVSKQSTVSNIGAPNAISWTDFGNLHVYTQAGCYFTYVSSQLDVSQALGSRKLTYSSYDINGNLLTQSIKGFNNPSTSSPEYTTVINNTYQSAGNALNGIANKLQTSAIGQNLHTPTPDVYLIEKSYDFDPATGNLATEHLIPNNQPQLETTTEYSYDLAGLVTSVKHNGRTETGSQLSRKVNTEYDTQSRFAVKTTNDIGEEILSDSGGL